METETSEMGKLLEANALVEGAVLALLQRRSVTLSELLQKAARIANPKETKAALERLAVAGKVSVTLEMDRGRGTMACGQSVDFRLRSTPDGKPGSLAAEIAALVLAIVTGTPQRLQAATLSDFLTQVPREDGAVRLSTVAQLMSPVVTMHEVRDAVALLASGGMVSIAYVSADVLITPVPERDWKLPVRRPGPPAVQVTTAATVPDPEPAQQVAATGGETIISRAVGAIRGRKRQTS